MLLVDFLAEQQFDLFDGGAAMDATLNRFFPHDLCIFDYFHVQKHLVELGNVLFVTNG